MDVWIIISKGVCVFGVTALRCYGLPEILDLSTFLRVTLHPFRNVFSEKWPKMAQKRPF